MVTSVGKGGMITPVAESTTRPDLFLDGEALADRVSYWALKNTNSNRLDHGFRMELPRLYKGTAFFPAKDPRRVALRAWLLAQPDDSVFPHALIEKAIQIAGGNIELGLVVSWDVLRENFDDGYGRNRFPRTKKLIDITGERAIFRGNRCPDSMGTIRGDNFSAWYHFVGTALLTVSSANGWLMGPGGAEAFTNLMISVEQGLFGSRQLIDSQKRIAIDRAGARFGSQLVENLNRFTDVQSLIQHRKPGRPYLYDNPAEYGEAWHLKPGQNPCDFVEQKRNEDRVEKRKVPPNFINTQASNALGDAAFPEVNALPPFGIQSR